MLKLLLKIIRLPGRPYSVDNSTNGYIEQIECQNNGDFAKDL